jgi:holo-[acyl-carrier protein] synthase
VILGIGTDLADIRRIGAAIDRFGERFLDRVFTETERARSEARAEGPHTGRIASYAKRWAAKEACSKALGTGLRMGVAWREMAVFNLASGQPRMRVEGGAAERLRRMTPEGHEAVIHVTLTDDHPWAQAFVMIEATPAAAIRAARPEDAAAIRALLGPAFGGPEEAELVEALRRDGDAAVELVAEREGRLVGHVLLSRMEAPAGALALAPLAVAAEARRRGVGARLTREALARAAQAGASMLFVLGEPAYYRRFGFRAEAAAGFASPWAGPHLMALALSSDAPQAGDARHASAFHAQ